MPRSRFLTVVAAVALAVPAAALIPAANVAAQDRMVTITCDKDVHITGVPGDTYSFDISGACLDPNPPGAEDQINIQNADASGTWTCATQFDAPGFLSRPKVIEVDSSPSSAKDQTGTLTDHYCYAPAALNDPGALYELPAGTPPSRMDWYFYTNKALPEGAMYISAYGMTLLAKNAMGTPLRKGAVVGTISDNGPMNFKIIYDGPAAPTIAITGSRINNVVEVTGATTGFKPGAKLTVHFRTAASGAYTAGPKLVVKANGKISWSRAVTKNQTLSVYLTGAGVSSNTMTFRP